MERITLWKKIENIFIYGIRNFFCGIYKKKKEIIMFIQGETGIKLSDVIFKDDMFMTQVGKFSKAELLKKYKKQNCPEVNS